MVTMWWKENHIFLYAREERLMNNKKQVASQLKVQNYGKIYYRNCYVYLCPKNSEAKKTIFHHQCNVRLFFWPKKQISSILIKSGVWFSDYSINSTV